ncbi:MAG: glycosyltransferase [Chloroherpetonaceae bacterium]|nr:glycosyltransferase [Chloroherpetonaceae bacterium]
MNLLIISAMYGRPWGGSEELWYKIALFYKNNNYNVSVIAPYWDTVPKKHQELKSRGIKISYVLKPHRFNFILWRLKKFFPYLFVAKNEYLELINKYSPDAIIVSQGHVFSAVSHKELFYALMNSNSSIYLISQYNTELTILDMKEIRLIRSLYDKCKAWFFVSKNNLKLAEHQLAYSLSRAKVLYNLPSFESNEMLQFPSFDLICFSMVSRLDILDKGHDILFRVLSKEKWLKRKWILNLYGSGKDEEYLKELAVFYNISDRIFFNGNVSDIKDTWRKNHILLMPSRAEGTPLSLIEAFSVGRPAVVTDVGGNAEWVSEGFTGFLADAPTPKLFDEALDKMWMNRDQLKILGENAYNFSKKRIKELNKEIAILN